MSLAPVSVGRALPPRRELPARPTAAVATPNASLVGRSDITDSLADFHLLLDAPLAPLPPRAVRVGGGDRRPWSRPAALLDLLTRQ